MWYLKSVLNIHFRYTLGVELFFDWPHWTGISTRNTYGEAQFFGRIFIWVSSRDITGNEKCNVVVHGDASTYFSMVACEFLNLKYEARSDWSKWTSLLLSIRSPVLN